MGFCNTCNIYIYEIYVTPKPTPYTPFLGVLLSALGGKYIFEQCTPKQIGHFL